MKENLNSIGDEAFKIKQCFKHCLKKGIKVMFLTKIKKNNGESIKGRFEKELVSNVNMKTREKFCEKSKSGLVRKIQKIFKTDFFFF